MKNVIIILALLSLGGCFVGVSMPHGQKPGLIVGLNMGVK